MKQPYLFLIVVSASCALVLLGGCGKPNDQGTTTRRNPAKPAHGGRGADTNPPVVLTIAGRQVEGLQLTDTGEGMAPLPAENGTVRGKFSTPDGTTYVGEYRNKQPNGMGIMTDTRGRDQKGEWRNGIEYRVGGTWVGPDGTIEVGSWNRDGSPSTGTIWYKDGRIYKGTWKLAVGTPEIPDGMGTMTWPDGRQYVGQFHDGQMDGTGKMTYPDGKIEDGKWAQGKFVPAQ
jgi:hypothetical protein